MIDSKEECRLGLGQGGLRPPFFPPPPLALAVPPAALSPPTPSGNAGRNGLDFIAAAPAGISKAMSSVRRPCCALVVTTIERWHGTACGVPHPGDLLSYLAPHDQAALAARPPGAPPPAPSLAAQEVRRRLCSCLVRTAKDATAPMIAEPQYQVT